MNKKTLQSFAAGMILSTAVLTITFYLGDYNKSQAVTKTTVDQYLDKNDLVSLEKEQFDRLTEREEVAKAAEEAKAEEEAEKKAAEEAKAEEEAEKKAAEEAKAEEEAEKKAAEEAKATEVTITIKEGMVPSEVANQLESAGIISSAEKFISYMENNELENYLQLGSHKFTKGMDYDEIAKVLTD
ncbi:endolytic transglycosylase MltG [Bacillus carboniphilus]|uniref:Endolytic transglycosylase MltG n=1 Tax=Bacillus carboniphilus TaxID=86663 RepID=A0ABY9JYT2_9BACI|nr:endolytic transglycosylase MltG [Bacillus carboniphilus]WLR43949.1 endolytic transglycosylase MltG [Bacillus carboniphilus]